MPLDMLGADGIICMAGVTALIAICALLVHLMTNEHVIRACELGDVLRTHCCVYSACFCCFSVHNSLIVVLKRANALCQAMWVARVLMSVSAVVELLCLSASHSHRALRLPACRHALGGSWLAFVWYTYVPLDVAFLVFYLYCVVMLVLE